MLENYSEDKIVNDYLEKIQSLENQIKYSEEKISETDQVWAKKEYAAVIEENKHNIAEIKKTLENIKEIKSREENQMENQKFEDGGAAEATETSMINLNEINADPSNPLEEKQIQNADISTQEYVPISKVCDTVDTVAPVSMLYEMNKSLSNIDRKVRGVDYFVMERLGYDNLMDLCEAFSGEQVDAIANAIYQIERGQALIVGDQTGLGKGRSQPIDSKVLTINGFVEMGSLKVGSKVISVDGKETKVIGIYPQGKIDVYEIVFSDGSKTECSADHLWTARNKQQKYDEKKNPDNLYCQYKVFETKELMKDSRIKMGYSIPLVSPISFKFRETRIDPYLLGVLLGDACIRDKGIELISADDEILNSVSNILYDLDNSLGVKKNRHQHYQLSKKKTENNRLNDKNILLTELRNLELTDKTAPFKFIPEIYKINSVEVRLAILQGLMDTDGYINKDGSCMYYTSSSKLAEDIEFIVRSLGGTTTRGIKKEPKYKNNKGEVLTGLPCHIVYIKLPNEFKPFRLQRKLERIKDFTKYFPQRVIRSITKIGQKECQCIKVDHPTSLYVTDDFIVTHNTAAGIIRYAKKVGKTPIFLTQKPNLFTDIYRDLIAIGSDDAIPLEFNVGESERERKVTISVIKDKIKEDIENGSFDLEYDTDKLFLKGNESVLEEVIEAYRELYFPSSIEKVTSYRKNTQYESDIRGKKRVVPFIVNAKDEKTKIKDDKGNILYYTEKPIQTQAFESGTLPNGYDVVVLTYSQINKQSNKVTWLSSIALDSIIIMDESHTASGESATGKIVENIIEKSYGVCFLSATFAKKPANMPIYAMKTAIRDADMDKDNLISAINYGGVALQEILSSQLVSEGQMLRRQRSYEGVIVNYNYLDDRMLDRDVPLPQFDLKESHQAISDKVTNILRRIISFQKDTVNPIIERMDDEFAERQMSAGTERANVEGGINNYPIFSGIFNLINQLLLSIKAEAVAEYAVMRLKEGKKVVIGLASTLESFLDYMIEDEGGKIKTDFGVILRKRLEKTLQYTIKNPDGTTEKEALNPNEYPEIDIEFNSILEDIENASTGITISPIDVIVNHIKKAGFEIGEVTGRNKYVEFLPDNYGLIKDRRKEPANDLFRKYNDNEIDCLIINQSGAVGASAHAIKTKKVDVVNYDSNGNPIIPTSLYPKDEVKQRVMIILQAELDINNEVQKRGRINRTGQIFKPIYDYVISSIPAEERLMMMLQKKLKSLDANTTSNQKESSKVLNVVDFLNIYGDEKVAEFLVNNPSFNQMTGELIKIEDGKLPENADTKNLAHRVSGRVAVLSIENQNNFYKTVSTAYQDYEKKLRGEDKWNLEVESIDLEAKTLNREVFSVGNPDSASVFGAPVFIEKCEVNNLRKPYKKDAVMTMVQESLVVRLANEKTLKFTAEEKVKFIKDELLKNAMAMIEADKNYYEKRKEFRIKDLMNSPTVSKKKGLERSEYIEEKTKIIEEEIEIQKQKSIDYYKSTANKIARLLDFFKPSRIISYPTSAKNEEIYAVCLGVDVDFNLKNPFTPSALSVRFVFPNSIRFIRMALSDTFLDKIIETTNNSSYRYSDESDFTSFIEDWDNLIQNSISNRITRYIVTGNILKAFSNTEFMMGGKLVSYTTIDKEIKKGILLSESYKAERQQYVNIPIKSALKYIKETQASRTVRLSDEIILQMTYGGFKLIIPSKSKISKDKDLIQLTVGNDIKKVSGEYRAEFYLDVLPNVIDILWNKYKINVSIPASIFESIKDQFDIDFRETGTKDGVEELLQKMNKDYDDYEKEQSFVKVDESELNTLSELEREVYDLRKRNAELELQRKLYKVYASLGREIEKRKKEKKQMEKMEDGGGVGINKIKDIDNNDDYELITNSQDLSEIYENYIPKFLTERNDMTDRLYSENIGGAFVKFADGDVEKIFVYEGEIPELNKPLFEVYPKDEYFS